MYKFDPITGRFGAGGGNANVPATAAILPPAQFVACYPLISVIPPSTSGIDLSTRPITHFDPAGFSAKWSADNRQNSTNMTLSLQGCKLPSSNVLSVLAYANANWNAGGNNPGALYLDGTGMGAVQLAAVGSQIQLKCAAAEILPATEVLAFTQQELTGGTAAQYSEYVIDEPTAIAQVAALTTAGFNSPSYYYGSDSLGWEVICYTDCLDDGTHGPAGYTLLNTSVPATYINTLSGTVFSGNNGDTVTAIDLAADAALWLATQIGGHSSVATDGVGNATITYGPAPGPGTAQYGGSYTAYTNNVTGATFTLTNGSAGANYAFNQGTDFTIVTGDTAADVMEKVLTAIQGYSSGVFPATYLGSDTIVFSPAVSNVETSDFGSITAVSGGVFSTDSSTTIAGIPANSDYIGWLANSNTISYNS